MDKFAHLASFEEIVDFNLNIPRAWIPLAEEEVEPLTDIVAKINQTNADHENLCTASLLNMLSRCMGRHQKPMPSSKKFVQELGRLGAGGQGEKVPLFAIST